MQRYITGQVTEREKRKIEAWLDVKKTPDGSDLVLSEEDEEKLFRKITANIDNEDQIRSFRPASHSMLSNRWWPLAASVLVVALSSYFIWYMVDKNAIYETATYDARGKTILDDGTIVWLETNSRLSYSKDNGLRNVTLTGAALFEVAKDPTHPFIISCGDAQVTVVGTSFYLENRDANVNVKVLTGSVRFSSSSDTTGVMLTPNETATALPNTAIIKFALPQDEKIAITSPTDYNMVFRNDMLASVVEAIERKFDVTVVLGDPRAAKCRITANFTDHSLDSTLSMLTELLDVEYGIEEKTVTITGDGCY